MKNFIRKINTYLLYTILFIVLSIIVFFSFIKTGRSFVWNSDILNLNSPQLYTAIVLLGIYCAGMSFIAYCNYNKKSKFATLVGALIYTFSGYMLYEAIRYPIIASGAILLPLMFLGIDRILKKDKYIFFIVISAISALPLVFSIYPLYTVTIFTLLYAIIKYFNEYKDKGKKTFAVKLIKMVLCYIIGILFTSILLLHTINIFKTISLNIDFGFTYYDFNYYVRTLFMSSKTAFWAKPYISPLVLTILPIAVINFKKNRENRTFLINLVALVIIFAIPFLSYAMNGFSFEPNKWGFAFNFVLAYLVTVNIRNDLIYSPREFKFVKKMLIIYLILWFLIRSHIGNFALITFILAFIYLIILVARSLDYKELKENQQFEYAENLKGENSQKIKARVKIVLLLALMLNIVFFSWYLFSHLKYATDFAKFSEANSVIQNQTSLPATYEEINFEFDGKYKSKIIDGNKLNITKKYKSFELKFDTSNLTNCEIYLVINNLKYLVNDQYSVTAKYNNISQKKIIRDKVKTPNYVKNPDILLDLGYINKDSNTVKLTLSSIGSYKFDDIKLIAVQK